ncbi:hypothetical protein J421_5705 (plasmid) [Gemmatirosa kalamazoonensis]|uniref:Uncharacterized protein n=1 Tax=Gemmatirosa kalamazoonensis TaxID=861299 RepID=W0RSG9_9BACT|nr:hypothetical protein J421_5705 [Gemmatirosa kalamazoonensis]
MPNGRVARYETCVYFRSATRVVGRVHRYKGRYKHQGLSFWKVPIAAPA